MRKSIKLAVLGIVAVLATAFAAGTASAITAEPAGAIRNSSLGLVTFRGGEINVQCRVTLTGSIDRTIEEHIGSLVGSITSSAANECRGGTARPLAGTWAIALEARDLTRSPKTLNLRFTEVAFLIEAIGVSCLYRGTVFAQLEAEGSPLTTRLVTITRTSVTRSSGSIFCPATGTLSGTFELSTQTLRL